jgi:quercetin dioxygenase-like cupin family protein
MTQMNPENYCFCELAPLYALDLLNEQEQYWVEQQLAECPELLEELASYQSAVTAIPYSNPIVPMAADLKNRLFERLELDSPESLPVKETILPPAFSVVRSHDLIWQSHEVPGVSVAVLHIDEVKREIVGLLRADPGAYYPLHRHAATEEIYMLTGDLVIDDQVYGAGDYIRSAPGSVHDPYSVGGCTFLFHTSMDNEYISSAVANPK